ncbi:MAG TPA: TonB C-terminal domain-containing protein [Gemmatimonadaceae bacterium]
MRATAGNPKLFSGAIVSLMLHGGLIAAALTLRAAPTPQAPVYRVRLIGGPAGPRSIGVVRPKPAEPQPETPPPSPKPTPPAAKTAPPAATTPPPETRKTVPAPTAKSRPTPEKVTPTGPPKSTAQPQAAAQPTTASKTTQSKSTTPLPTAGGGPEGGKGADVATIDTPGIEFPYPYYTDNIARQVIKEFGSSNARFITEIRFVIQRDGTVDPESIQYVTRSGNFNFDVKAKGAIEAVANGKRFGPLPPGFREDILPVTFRFSPQLWR